MVPDQDTKYQWNLCRHLWEKHEKTGHNYPILVEPYILFYMLQQPTVSDHSTKYEENTSSHHRGMCKGRQKATKFMKKLTYIYIN